MNSTIGILSVGYPYFLQRFHDNETDLIETSLLLRKAIAMRGKKAAEVFYDQSKFERKGATPKRFQKTLFGQKGVQGLDGKAHQKRKDLFMDCMSESSIHELKKMFEKHWRQSLKRWGKEGSVQLFGEVEEILAGAACEWVGVPLKEEDLPKRAKQLSLMIDSSGAVGVRHLAGRLARKNAEIWIEELVAAVRENRIDIANDSILYSFCFYKDIEGKLLDKNIVAVELLNLLRPIVAIARYIVFTAHALYDHPGYKKFLKSGGEEDYQNFVQEVRRFYPFFPFVAAKVRQSFDWQGHHFPKGRRVLLDLYATNHDEKLWENPDTFYPERFKSWNGSPFNFIPQGGGDHHQNHRCAGEWITIELTKSALNFLVNKMTYEVPEQDLHISMSRIPATPRSRFIISEVKKVIKKKKASKPKEHAVQT